MSALWYMANVSYISQMNSSDPVSTQALFGNPASFGISNSQSTPGIPTGYACTPLLKYIAYGQLLADISGSSQVISGITYTPVAINAAYGWLMYDCETWSPNPPSPYTSAAAQAETDDPWTYMADFVALAHAHGYKVVLAPALDLGNDATSVHPKMSGETNQAWYTRVNIAGAAAATGAEVVHIQAQSLTTTGAYASFFASCLSQVIASGTSTSQQVSTGISTSYGTPAQMLAAVQSATGAAGVWLNATNATISTAVSYAELAVAALSPPPGLGMTSTFMQPGTPAGGSSNLTWNQARWNEELIGAGTGMYEAGFKSVIMQWSADVYADTAYYPSPTVPNSSAQIVPALYAAAQQMSPAMGVWLGLPISTADGTDYYTFYEHCVAGGSYNSATLLPFAETVASELHTLYGAAIAGWYIPQECDTNYPEGSAQAAAAAAYFQSLCSYLHSNFPGIPVMTSPFFSNILLTPSQFAATIAQLHVTGSAASQPDIIALQTGAGDGSAESADMTPAQISAYFAAVAGVLAGSGVALQANCDMYDEGTGGGPITLPRLVASMQAARPYVTGYTGFSFTSQMSPASLGTSSVYSAYVNYLSASHPGGFLAFS